MELGKKAPTMRMKACKDIFVTFGLEIFSADFHSDDLFIAQGRRKAAATQPTLLPDDTVSLANKQKNSDNKTVSIHCALLVNRA